MFISCLELHISCQSFSAETCGKKPQGKQADCITDGVGMIIIGGISITLNDQYVSHGRAKLTSRNYSTGEILAEYEIEIFGD